MDIALVEASEEEKIVIAVEACEFVLCKSIEEDLLVTESTLVIDVSAFSTTVKVYDAITNSWNAHCEEQKYDENLRRDVIFVMSYIEQAVNLRMLAKTPLIHIKLLDIPLVVITLSEPNNGMVTIADIQCARNTAKKKLLQQQRKNRMNLWSNFVNIFQ